MHMGKRDINVQMPVKNPVCDSQGSEPLPEKSGTVQATILEKALHNS